MQIKRVKSRLNSKTGVVRIQRASYSTVSGTTQKNSWWELRKACVTRDGGMCVVCKLNGRFVEAKEVHHIKELSKGGINTLSNLISLCLTCHNKRHKHLHNRK